ncbi:MAG: alpha/beta hydrolase [Polyangiaceae bacterium]
MSELLDHPLLSERYFFPRPDPPAHRFVVEPAAGISLACARLPGKPGSPVVLFFHGNGEVVGDWLDADLTTSLVAAGVGIIFAEYRGYGGSTGLPAFASMLDDALHVADAAGVSPDKLVVYGRSIGSIYAVHVAANRPVGALVLESGIADVLERVRVRVTAADLGVTDAELERAVRARFDQQAKLAQTTCPVLVLHARGDHLVDPSHAERLALSAKPRSELVLFARGDHNSIHAYNGVTISEKVLQLARSIR